MTVKLAEYKKPEFAIPKVKLHFSFFDDYCIIKSELLVRCLTKNRALHLDYGNQDIQSLKVNGNNWK